MSIPLTDRTKLLAVIGNLDIGDVADPALRSAVFQEIYNYMDGLASAFNSITTNSNNIDGGNLTDSFYLFFRQFDGGNLADVYGPSDPVIDGGSL
jgi:hypothetical protein